MTVRKHDYTTLEHEYVYDPNKISIRALCRKHDIKSYSSVAAYSREHGWDEKREEVQNRKSLKVVERMADRMAEEEISLVDEVRHEWLTVIRAATYKFAEDLKDPSYRIRVPDLIQLIDKGLVLIGEPSSRTEERHLALTGSLGELPADVLRQLVERTRPDQPHAGRESLPSRAGTQDPRPN